MLVDTGYIYTVIYLGANRQSAQRCYVANFEKHSSIGYVMFC